MILTVTPNTAIDKTYVIDGFNINQVHRPIETRTTAGGKGINVARVLKTLGREALATGFVGGRIGEAIIDSINIEKLPHDFVEVQDESRLCIAAIDKNTSSQTEINENGPQISLQENSNLLKKIEGLVYRADFIVLCGSCPPGVPFSFYGDIIKIARDAGIKTILDTSGDHFKEAIKSAPFMVKPNIYELSQLAEHELFTQEDVLRAAKSLKQFGVGLTAVTMGKSGALLTDGNQAWLAIPPKINFASAVGSGDTFVAAFLDAYMDNKELDKALVWATAAGTANASTFGAGFCTKESIIEICQGVSLTRLD